MGSEDDSIFLFRFLSPSLRFLLSQCGCIDSLYKIHALLIVGGLSQHEFIVKEALNKYLFFCNPWLAESVYLSVKRPTLLFQNVVLRSFSIHRYHAHLLSLFAASQRLGFIKADNFTFPVVIKACAALWAFRSGKEVHCAVLRSGYGGSLVVQTALVDFYSKIGLLEYSSKVFDGITDRDLVSWNALISGYSLNGCNQEAFGVLREMILSDFRPNGSAFVSVIPLCARLRAPVLGGSLHAFALKCGTSGDETLVPTLMSMYADFGNLNDARMLFDMQEVKSLVSYNSMISAYFQNGMPGDALQVFKLMHSGGEMPDLVTIVSILPSCVDDLRINYGESVHAIATKAGLAEQLSVVTSLVSMYGKLRELHTAECLFQAAPEKSILLFNAMLSCYILNSLPGMGLATFCGMIIQGVNPDAISIIGAISACTMSGYVYFGTSCHAYSIRSGLHSNINVMNALLAFYFDCNQLHRALKLFNMMQVRNIVSWNTLICGWVDDGDMESAVASFRQIGREDMKFDLITMISILPSFYQSKNISLGMSFHALAIKRGFDSDTTLTNALMSMYANCGHMEASHGLFESINSRSTVSWNALMTGYRKFKSPKEVMQLLGQMKEDGQKLNTVTLLNLLPSCAAQLQGKSIHAFALRNLYKLENAFHTSAMCMYARFQNFEYCYRLFGMIGERNVAAWNTMMSIYAHREHAGKVLNFFREMLDAEVSPDTITMLTLVSVLCQLGNLVLAQCIHSFIIRKGFGKSTSLINSLIDMYSRTGSILIAKELFDDLQEKDLISWSTMLSGYGMHGDGEAAVELFIKMQETGVRPDDITFVSILSACGHAGLVEEGRMFFKEMVNKHQITPRMEHYTCLIDLLSRGGHVSEAFNVVRRLPFKPSAELLESLLGACHCHGDAEVGEGVGMLLLELYPTPSSYVILSNIYSAAERWEDSGRLRCGMDAKAMKKQPGISSVCIG